MNGIWAIAYCSVFFGVIFGVCIFQNESNDATVEAGEQSLEDLMKQMKSL